VHCLAQNPPTGEGGGAETYEGTWFALTDVQFSVVALIRDDDATIEERVLYEPYGRATLLDPADYNADGVVATQDTFDFLTDWSTGKRETDINRVTLPTFR
jgi:hypothetical protein